MDSQPQEPRDNSRVCGTESALETLLDVTSAAAQGAYSFTLSAAELRAAMACFGPMVRLKDPTPRIPSSSRPKSKSPSSPSLRIVVYPTRVKLAAQFGDVFVECIAKTLEPATGFPQENVSPGSNGAIAFHADLNFLLRLARAEDGSDTRLKFMYEPPVASKEGTLRIGLSVAHGGLEGTTYVPLHTAPTAKDYSSQLGNAVISSQKIEPALLLSGLRYAQTLAKKDATIDYVPQVDAKEGAVIGDGAAGLAIFKATGLGDLTGNIPLASMAVLGRALRQMGRGPAINLDLLHHSVVTNERVFLGWSKKAPAIRVASSFLTAIIEQRALINAGRFMTHLKMMGVVMFVEVQRLRIVSRANRLRKALMKRAVVANAGRPHASAPFTMQLSRKIVWPSWINNVGFEDAEHDGRRFQLRITGNPTDGRLWLRMADSVGSAISTSNVPFTWGRSLPPIESNVPRLPVIDILVDLSAFLRFVKRVPWKSNISLGVARAVGGGVRYLVAEYQDESKQYHARAFFSVLPPRRRSK